ncbi:hypothetical protein DRN67_02135 [Candidatus Micrarchaeota archaeon]|nr:MAG: hypothetical protein DRN67_02135 [Candidatus Micrarchaeota archaeon]
MDDEEVKLRVSLLAKLYTLGSRLSAEKQRAIDKIGESRGSKKKELQFHQACERYYEVDKLQKQHRKVLERFHDEKVPVEKVRKEVAGLERKLKRAKIKSITDVK